MKVTPLLFKAPMVQALLGGHKTQTRRIMKLQPTCSPELHPAYSKFHGPRYQDCMLATWPGETEFDYSDCHCPYGKPGDLIWVRENLHIDVVLDATYSADGEEVESLNDVDWVYRHESYTGTVPAIHAPKFTSRLTLKITDIRAQRIQDINDSDAQAEGICRAEFYPDEGWPLCIGWMPGPDDRKTVLDTTPKPHSGSSMHRPRWPTSSVKPPRPWRA